MNCFYLLTSEKEGPKIGFFSSVKPGKGAKLSSTGFTMCMTDQNLSNRYKVIPIAELLFTLTLALFLYPERSKVATSSATFFCT